MTVEALHYGLPVIGFDAPGTKEIFARSSARFGEMVSNNMDASNVLISMLNDKDLWADYSAGAFMESLKYDPREISTNLLQQLWNDRYHRK